MYGSPNSPWTINPPPSGTIPSPPGRRPAPACASRVAISPICIPIPPSSKPNSYMSGDGSSIRYETSLWALGSLSVPSGEECCRTLSKCNRGPPGSVPLSSATSSRFCGGDGWNGPQVKALPLSAASCGSVWFAKLSVLRAEKVYVNRCSWSLGAP